MIVLCLSGVIFLFSRQGRSPADPATDGPLDPATISVDRVEHTATRNGRIEWRLQADEVRYLNQEKKAIFHEVSITFFSQNNEEIHLAARKGEIDTETQNIRASGGVQVERGGYLLKAPQMSYFHDRKMFVAREGVRVASEGSRLSANAMTFYLDSNIVDLQGNVEGITSESIEF